MIFDKGIYIIQSFGNKDPFFAGKVHPDYYAQFGTPEGHPGLDIVPLDWDFTIKADWDGVVDAAMPDYSNGLGAYVRLKIHFNSVEYYVIYGHLDSWADNTIGTGFIKKGQVLGVMGGSGFGRRNYYAPHLHFEVRPVENVDYNNGFNGSIDPMFLLQPRK